MTSLERHFTQKTFERDHKFLIGHAPTPFGWPDKTLLHQAFPDNGINALHCPGNSLDRNSIEYIYDSLETKLAWRNFFHMDLTSRKGRLQG